MNNRDGIALVMTVFAMFFVGLLVITVLRLKTNELAIASNQKAYLRALYIADAGVEDAFHEIVADKTWRTGFYDKEFPPGSGNYYSVTASNSGSDVILTSTSQAGGRSATITATVSGL